MTDANNIDIHLIEEIDRLASLFRSRLRAVCEKEGLSPIQANILSLVAKESESVSSLALKLMVTKPTVSDSVKSLVSKKLIEENNDEGDKRVRRLKLTRSGIAKNAAMSNWYGDIQAALSEIYLSEKAVLLDNLQMLYSKLLNSSF